MKIDVSRVSLPANMTRRHLTSISAPVKGGRWKISLESSRGCWCVVGLDRSQFGLPAALKSGSNKVDESFLKVAPLLRNEIIEQIWQW